MTHKGLFLLAATLLASPLFGHAAPGDAYGRIEKGCFRYLKSDFPRQPSRAERICACVRKNYEAHAGFSDEELEIMARSHEEDQSAETELQDEKYTDVLNFDYDTTEGCLKDPAYRAR